jgi:hypothetical protein
VRSLRLTFAAAAAALVALASPTGARADAVTDWNAIASDAIVARAAQPPPVSALSFAMVQGAVYDAVNAIDQVQLKPYLAAPPANPCDSKEAAVASAAYQVLIGLFPGQLTILQPIYDGYVAPLPDEPAGSKAAGIAAGEAAAQAMLDARAHDGRGGPAPELLPEGPGVWRPVPPFFTPDPAAWVGNVTPFIVPNVPSLVDDFGETKSGEEIRACADAILNDYDDAPVRSFVLTLAERRIRDCLREPDCAVLA